MTERQQRAFYFPLWNRVCDAQDWRLCQTRLVGTREQTHGLSEIDALYQRVWTEAEQLAKSHHRSVTPEDLRHACHVVALGRDISSKDMTSKQLDRVATLFKLLVNPDDIDAAIEWDHPEKGDRKRLVYAIKKFAGLACTGHADDNVEAYINAICKHRRDWPNYNYPFWEDLELHQLRQLVRTLSERARAKGHPVDKHVVPPSGGPVPAMINVGRNTEAPF